MEKLQLRLTPAEADRIASALTHEAETELRDDLRAHLQAQAARLNHLAAKARARDARHAGT